MCHDCRCCWAARVHGRIHDNSPVGLTSPCTCSAATARLALHERKRLTSTWVKITTTRTKAHVSHTWMLITYTHGQWFNHYHTKTSNLKNCPRRWRSSYNARRRGNKLLRRGGFKTHAVISQTGNLIPEIETFNDYQGGAKENASKSYKR